MIQGIKLLAKMCISQTANWYYAVKLFIFSIIVRARKSTIMKGYGWEIRVKKFEKKVTLYFKDLSDYLVFKEIFFEEDYGHDFNLGGKWILDIGANNGFTAVFLALKYPNSRVYALEPDPRTYLRLVVNTQEMKQVVALQVAVTDEPGLVSFYSMPRALSSSMIIRNESAQEIQILGQTLDHIIESIGKDIGLLKFDVEGAEYKIVRSWKNQEKVENIVGELHLDLVDASKEKFFECISDFDITEFKRGEKRIVLYGTKK